MLFVISAACELGLLVLMLRPHRGGPIRKIFFLHNPFARPQRPSETRRRRALPHQVVLSDLQLTGGVAVPIHGVQQPSNPCESV